MIIFRGTVWGLSPVWRVISFWRVIPFWRAIPVWCVMPVWRVIPVWYVIFVWHIILAGCKTFFTVCDHIHLVDRERHICHKPFLGKLHKSKKSKFFFGKQKSFFQINYPQEKWRFYADYLFIHEVIHIIHRKNTEMKKCSYGNHQERMFCVEIIKMPKH